MKGIKVVRVSSIEEVFFYYRSGFRKKDQNHSRNSYQKIWKTNGLRTGALLAVISDIHRVCTNPEDPMDVRNNPQYTFSIRILFKFSNVKIGFDPF